MNMTAQNSFLDERTRLLQMMDFAQAWLAL
jgi:hypothetical protein